MLKAYKNSYDAIIIGAGISGLVCGCYLAKAGMKVLIVEQHYKPGGYCTSFKRQGFTFDAAPYCFGSYRKDGSTRKIFADLGIDKKLNIIRSDPSDIIITPDYKVSFWNDLDKTIEEFQTIFPEENNNIKKFFYFLLKPDLNSFFRIRNWTFQKLLYHYFINEKLKTILAAPLMGIGGLPPSLMSALMATQLFSEFIIDGGYYPVGGMQTISDVLAERFKELGGELLLSCPVKKIRIKDNKVTGIMLEKSSILSKFVISNCDARETFFKLLGKEKVGEEFSHKIKSMLPSISSFVLYLGIDEYFEFLPKPGTTLCFFSHYNLDKAYRAANEGNVEDYGGYMLRVSPDKSTINAIIPAPYKNKIYWNDNKYKFIKLFIDRIEKYSIPHLSKHIIYKDAATPHTLYRYTRNYKGAAFGWASIPSQFADPDFKKPSFIQNLYLTGHWTTQGLGIAGVANLGYNTANLLIKRNKMKKVI